MEKNIFEGVKFGDKFLTREGSEIVFIKEEKRGNKTWYKCIIIDDYGNDYEEYYHQDGRINYSSGEAYLDIVSKYQKPIDENVVRKLGNQYLEIIREPDDESSKVSFTTGYRMGWIHMTEFVDYRKAMEE